MPALCCATEVIQGAWMGSSPGSDLPEDSHGASKASGSVKSCIDRTVLRAGSSELAGLKGRERYSGPGRCLPCWMRLWSLRRSQLFSTRKGTHPWAGSLVVWHHPRERRKGPAERAPGGKGRSGYLANGTACPTPPCYPPPGPATPGIPASPLGCACFSVPQKPQLPGNLSRAFKQPPPKGACSGKNKAPTPKAHPASQGASEQYL